MSAALVSAADVAVIASDVWASVGADAGLVASPSPAGEQMVVGSVRIRGTFEGRVTLEMPATAADAVATAMLGGVAGVSADPADVADAVGELVNMIGGNIKSLMPAPSTLGLPAVERGPGPVDVPEAELCRADLSWDGTAVRVRVWADPPTPGGASTTSTTTPNEEVRIP